MSFDSCKPLKNHHQDTERISGLHQRCLTPLCRPPFPPPLGPGQYSFAFYLCLLLHSVQMESCSMSFCAPCFFHQAQGFSYSSMLWHIFVVHSLLLTMVFVYNTLLFQYVGNSLCISEGSALVTSNGDHHFPVWVAQ